MDQPKNKQSGNPPQPGQGGSTPGPMPREGGPAPGNLPPLGSPADLGTTSTTFQPGQSTPSEPAPTPGSAPQATPAQPGVGAPTAQAVPQAAATAPAPPVVGEETTSPPPATTSGPPVPATAAAPAAGSSTTAAVAAGMGTGHSPGAAAADAAAADRQQPVPQAPTAAPAPPPQAAAAGARAAALIRDQIEILTLRIVYDTQELVRVGAEGPDPVTVRTILETFAAALERGDQATFTYTYSRAARPNVPQINDQVLPFRLGLQIGGLIEGILRDAFNEGFQDDPALRTASVRLLEQMAIPAKRALLGEPRELVQWQAPRL